MRCGFLSLRKTNLSFYLQNVRLITRLLYENNMKREMVETLTFTLEERLNLYSSVKVQPLPLTIKKSEFIKIGEKFLNEVDKMNEVAKEWKNFLEKVR